MLGRIANNLAKEARSYPLTYLVLLIVLLGAFFIRVYRTQDLLGFYFDQGRDALVIWKFWHHGKFFLIGPVTGLAGIFLGPFYYYLIAPFYLIGQGNPVYPAVFLAFLSTLSILITYYLGWQMQDRITGLIASIIVGFSYYLVLAGRWLSNPTPILLTSVLLFLSFWKLIEGKTKRKNLWWLVIALLAGLSLHFEAASAIFYVPTILVFGLYSFYKRLLPNSRVLLFCFLLFFATLLPQILFNFRHENILFNNIKRVIFEEKSFNAPLDSFNLKRKKDFFGGVVSSKIFPGNVSSSSIFYFASLFGILSLIKKAYKTIFLFLIFFILPLLGYIFFQGNNGNIYDYYLTGYYIPMILLFSLGLGFLWRNTFGKVIILVFLVQFLNLNIKLVKNFLSAGFDGPTHITLGNQLQAVNWVFDDANDKEEFNLDVYVPPVIPYAYDYLFLWQGTLRHTQGKCSKDLCGLIDNKQMPIIYVLYEADPPHPERLSEWLSRYENITEVEKEVRFGGISVQRRIRT